MKVFICGWDYLAYQGTYKDAHNAIKNLIANETEVNFHIYVAAIFESICLTAIEELKKEREDIKITTTFVTRSKKTISFEQEKALRLSEGFDDVILYPDWTVDDYKKVNYPNLRKRMRKWMSSFIDTFLICYYPTLNFRELEEFEKLKKLKKLNINIVNVYNKKTDELLQEMLNEMDPLAQKIYNNIRAKVPLSVTAKEVGLPDYQVRNILYDSLFNTMWLYQKKYGKSPSETNLPVEGSLHKRCQRTKKDLE